MSLLMFVDVCCVDRWHPQGVMGTFSSVTSETVAAELSASGSSGRCCDSSTT